MNCYKQKYDVYNVGRINIASKNKETIGSFIDSKDSYVDLKNSTHFEDGNVKLYKKGDVELVEPFMGTIKSHALTGSLLNANGEVYKYLTRDEIFDLLAMANKMDNVEDSKYANIDNVAKEVSEVCATAMRLKGSKRENFKNLLKSVVFVELAKQEGSYPLTIAKKGLHVDYRVNRILKYLDINVILTRIADFQIQYTKDAVSLNGFELYKAEPTENKVNSIVRK